jgi:hypothetical protein
MFNWLPRFTLVGEFTLCIYSHNVVYSVEKDLVSGYYSSGYVICVWLKIEIACLGNWLGRFSKLFARKSGIPSWVSYRNHYQQLLGSTPGNAYYSEVKTWFATDLLLQLFESLVCVSVTPRLYLLCNIRLISQRLKLVLHVMYTNTLAHLLLLLAI